jgi:hypothetical protein
MSRNRASESDRNAESASEYRSDFEHEGDEDLGYGLSDIHDDINESYEEMRARFAAKGPVMPVLSYESKKKLEAEKAKWIA